MCQEMPEIYFLLEQFRLMILPNKSLSPCELETQSSNREADTLSLGYRRPSEIFVADA